MKFRGMRSSFLSLISLFAICKSQQDHKIGMNLQQFTIHLEQEGQYLNANLSQAVDVMLIHHGKIDTHQSDSICSIEQRGVDLETQEIQIISAEDLDSETFDIDAPLDVKTFISMGHIKDGLLAIDSSMQIYMLKFDYNELHNFDKDQSLTEVDEGKQPSFASLRWTAILKAQEITISTKELPQLVYSSEFNQGFIVYTDSLLNFSVDLMEQNQDLIIHNQNTIEWISRKVRGWTKTLGKLLYSAVGPEGIDIYLLRADSQLYFKENIQTLSSSKLNVQDIEVIFCPIEGDQQECHQLILLNLDGGIMIVQVNRDKDDKITYQLLMQEIGILQGGIALDTIDGKTIIAAYHQGNKYLTQELHVDIKTQLWVVVATYKQRTKIVDVKMNDDIAVIQGLNHHQIIFYGTEADLRSFSLKSPIYVTHGGMRDFDFFNTKQMFNPNLQMDMSKSGGYKFDDFMFGITSHKIFVSRYKITSPYVQCFSEDVSLNFQTFLYTAVYNTSNCNREGNPPCQQRIDFSIEQIMTLMYEGKMLVLLIVGLLIGTSAVSLVVTLWVFYRRYKIQQVQIIQHMGRISKKPQTNNDQSSNQSNNQLQMDVTISIEHK